MPQSFLPFRVAFPLSGLAAFFTVSSLSVLQAVDSDGVSLFRSSDGTGNNVSEPTRGSTGSPLIRLAPAEYGDATDLPRGVPVEDELDGDIETNEQTLPSARQISNEVHDQGAVNRPSARNLSQLFFQFGQFLSHDTGLSEPDGSVATGGATGLVGNESFAIGVPGGDPDFGFPEIPMTRSISLDAATSGTGLREQINTITAFIDASNVYGSTQVRSDALRTFVGGRLKSASGPDGDLLPLNTFGLENANPLHLPETSMFAAGDVRANEQVGLIAFHTLFMREHNRLAASIAQTDFPGANLSSPSVDEQIYQRARASVAAILQKITYYEWLPALIGFDTLPPYSGYRPWIDPQVANEFSTAAFRLGHTMLPTVYRLKDGGGNITPLALQNAFFNPGFISGNGIDGILRGQAGYHQQEIDRFIVDDVRNFLFGPGFGGLDLAALNIQRGRDHGIPSYHRLRQSYGLPGVSNFSDISRNSATISALATVFSGVGVQEMDAWSGGVSEDHIRGTNLGPTFTRIFVDQFVRLRDGDRFYFENRGVFPSAFIQSVFATNLSDVIRRNTNLGRGDVNQYSFFVPGYHPFQPDLTLGQRGAIRTHRGADVYNTNAARQRITVRGPSHRPARFSSSLQNDGAFQTRIGLRATLRSRHYYSARIFEAVPGRRVNQTSALFLGRYSRITYPGAIRRFSAVVRVVPRPRVRAQNSFVHLRAVSHSDRSAIDRVISRIRS